MIEIKCDGCFSVVKTVDSFENYKGEPAAYVKINHDEEILAEAGLDNPTLKFKPKPSQYYLCPECRNKLEKFMDMLSRHSC